MMKVCVNGQWQTLPEGSIEQAMQHLGVTETAAATALNGQFVPREQRTERWLKEGDALEILTPMQGG